MTEPACELVASERAALVVWRLARSEALTTDDVVRICGYVDRRGAHELMHRLARVLPLVFASGVWRVADCDK